MTPHSLLSLNVQRWNGNSYVNFQRIPNSPFPALLAPYHPGNGEKPWEWGSVASELSTLTTSDYREEEEVWRKEMGRGKKKTFVFIYTFPVQNKKVPPSAKEVSSSKIAAKEGKLEYA